MVLNKKGMVFTLVTITILSILAISYGAYSFIEDRTSINKRINTLNNFIDSIETDLPRQVYISGYRSIFILNKEIIDTNLYIDNVNESVNELFFNATLKGSQRDLMQDARFSAIQNTLSSNANKINAEISLLNPSLEITQDDPWNIKFILNVTLNITDKSGLASWNREAIIVSYVPTSNLVDPLYSIGTNGKLTNKVNQTPYTTFVFGSDYSNLTSHFQNSYYKASTLAPSYINRLEGDFSASPYGVESMVYPQNLADAGINVKEKSVIDYIYFSSDNPPNQAIPGVNNLILDVDHLEAYNLS